MRKLTLNVTAGSGGLSMDIDRNAPVITRDEILLKAPSAQSGTCSQISMHGPAGIKRSRARAFSPNLLSERSFIGAPAA
jgi:hypothetical protein